MASVTIDNVYKSFGSVQVIHGVSVDIQDGEFVILVGPSGCGKSTLLRMVAGLETITSGEIHIGFKLINNMPPKDRDIAMVFQSYALYPHMTVAENMSFSLRLRREKKSIVSAKVESAAEILGLAGLLDRYPRQLSGGQRQRVAMGRAIVRDPKVFLFDEPLSNLDAKLRVQMRGEIKELQQRLGTTTIYVTHDQIEAMTMADKIVVLSEGAIEQIGSPLEVYDRPANRFVAGFIGSPSMNFLNGTIKKGLPNIFQLEKGGSFNLDEIADDWDGRPAILGVRPEHFGLRNDGLCADAEVIVLEPTGSETQIRARIGNQEVSVIVRRRLPLNPCDPIRIRPRRSGYHLFDADNGQRLELEKTNNAVTRCH